MKKTTVFVIDWFKQCAICLYLVLKKHALAVYQLLEINLHVEHETKRDRGLNIEWFSMKAVLQNFGISIAITLQNNLKIQIILQKECNKRQVN